MTQALPAQTKALPSRPNLSYLKKLSKERLKLLRAKGASAKLADAQLHVAREFGFTSWRKLKAHLDAIAPAVAAASPQEIAAFLMEATSFSNEKSSTTRADALLVHEPRIATASMLTACVLGDVKTAEHFLAQDPKLARRAAGPRNWPPLLYLCFSKYLRARKRREPDYVALAKLLVANGADPNSFFVHEGFNETALFGAAGIANRPRLMRFLLEAGADPDDKGDRNGAESIYHACEHKDNACLKLLLRHKPRQDSISFCLNRKLDYEDLAGAKLMLDHGADPNFGSPTGDTTLMHAVRRGRSAKIIELLIARGADVNARNKAGMTPLRLARRLGRKALIKTLLRHGAVDDADDREQFLTACAAGNLRAAKKILKQEPDLVSRLSPDEMRIFPDAAASGNIGPVRHMLNLGFDINAKGDWGASAVHQAAWHGHLALTKFLISRGADLHQKQDFGGDALLTAMHGAGEGREKGPEIVALIARAMKPDDLAPYLKFAQQKDDPRILNALQKAASTGRPVSQHNTDWKPIMDAAFHGDVKAIKRLLAAGADSNIVSRTGHRYRPLHRAIEHKKLTPRGPEHEAVVRLLLEAGADPKLRGAPGQWTALQLAAMQSPRFVPLLIDRFGDLDIFHAAAVADDKRVAALLKKDPTLATGRDTNGATALHCCTGSAMFKVSGQHKNSLVRIAQMLIDAGADPNGSMDQNAEWPLPALYLCCGKHNNPAVAEVLFQAGATPYDNETVFHAADEQHEECLALIEKYAKPKLLAAECTKALAYQLHFGYTRGAPWLLAHGADSNDFQQWGESSLHSAVRNSSNEKTVKLLLDHGANVNLKNKDGQSPLKLAETLKRLKILSLLEERA
jgi:ankyrin repeat protein